MSEDKITNQLDNVLSTTGGVAGQKLGYFAGEAVTQVAAAGIGVGFGAVRSPLGHLLVSAPTSIVGGIIKAAKSDQAKAGMSKIGSITKKVASKVVDAELVQAVKNDISRIKLNVELIEGRETTDEPEEITDDQYAVTLCPACKENVKINYPHFCSASNTLCGPDGEPIHEYEDEHEPSCEDINEARHQ